MKPPAFFRAFALLAVMSLTASANTLEVINNNNAGAGSLRQQIADALSNDEIVFNTSVTGRILLASPLVISNKSLIVTGPGADRLRLDGNGVTRVLIVFQTNAPVQISGLSFTNGVTPLNGYGAGISNMGALFLSECSIVGNKGPAGSYTGGGIYNGLNAILGMTGCMVTDNQAAIGAGIYSSQAAAIGLTNCTIAANETFGNGGGISCSGDLIAIHCTITRNTSYTGSGGAAGLHMLGGRAYLGNCIIAWNFRTNSIRPDATGSAYTSWHYNFIGVTNGVDWSSGDATDQFGSETVPINPQLGPLQNNGGPTFTIAPLVGSPVIDQGNSLGVLTDQRGRPRPYTNDFIGSIPLGGDHSDIGAYEISRVTLVVSNLSNGDPGSLRQTIASASPVEVDTITFNSNLVGTIALTNGELVIGKSLVIQGPTATPITISGNNLSRVIRIASNGQVNISSLTIANGNSAAQGAGIYNDFGCILGLSNCAVIANISSVNGGGVANNGSFTAYNCTFSSNRATFTGGAIYTYAGPVALRNCTIVSNSTVSADGGGLCNYSLVAGTSNYIASTLVAGNSASGHADVIGVFTSGGYNLIGRIDYSTPGGGAAAGVPTSGLTNGINHDLAGSVAFPTNAVIGPLQNNGGPTFTHALKPGSPAIDKGKTSSLTADQRGAPRPFDFDFIANASAGDGSDIGAFELGSPLLSISPAGNDAILSWPFYYGDFSLQSVTNLTSTNWIAVPGTPVVTSNQYVLTNSPITGNKFYRLKGN